MEFIFDLLSRKVYNQGNQRINIKLYKFFIENISDFVDLKSIGFDWIWDYIVYQFEYWSSKKTPIGTFNQSWVFGKKAIDRWKNKNNSWQFFNQKFLNSYGIEKPIHYFSAALKEKWEEVRAINFGTPQGFINCQLDSIFDNESKYCKVCVYAEICEREV